MTGKECVWFEVSAGVWSKGKREGLWLGLCHGGGRNREGEREKERVCSSCLCVYVCVCSLCDCVYMYREGRGPH